MPVMIHGTGGGTLITDATATPSDVVNGKVFYNNDGRQVGTNDIGLKVLSTSVPYSSMGSISDSYNFVTTMVYDPDGSVRNLSAFSSSYVNFKTNKTIALNAKRILYFTYPFYPGIIYNIIYGGKYDKFICNIHNAGEQILDFSYVNGIVHLNTSKKQHDGVMISIYYI